MTLTELKTEIYKFTARSDLTNETDAAVKAATLKAHMSDYYSRDLVETGNISIGSEASVHSIDLSSYTTRFRTLKYFKKAEDTTDTDGTFLNILTPEETINSYGEYKTDTCYMAGTTLQVRSSTDFSRALIGYYQNPDITTGTFSSWIADDYPYIIIFDACRMVFNMIGLMEESRKYEGMTAEQYQLLKILATTDLGY